MKNWATALCLITGCATDVPTVTDDEQEITKTNPHAIAYDLAPGATKDIALGSFAAGTSLTASTCAPTPTRKVGVAAMAVEQWGQAITAPGACAAGQIGAFANFESRLGLENWTIHLTCSLKSISNCTGTMTWSSTNDFNGDLMNVAASYARIPNTSANASILLIDDYYGIFTDPNYGCSCHDDHPEGVVRLANNHFAITTDFGDSGSLYNAVIGSKPIANGDRLGTNVINNQVSDADRIVIPYEASLGQGRGHLGGSTKSGVYLLTAAEADNDSVNGLISIVDTTGGTFNEVNWFANTTMLSNNEGAAWVTSAKLGTGSSDPNAVNYIPPALQNTHLVIESGTNMGNVSVVYAPRDVNGVSSLSKFVGTTFGANFKPYAIELAPPNKDNQASLITQEDGQVFLMTLNGDVHACFIDPVTQRQICGNHGTGACEDSTEGTSQLFKVNFANCPGGKPMCFTPVASKLFQTNGIADMVRAAGTYIVPTGNEYGDQIMVYGLWATKVDDTHSGGCDDGHDGPFLRMMEF
ncbi:MAG: hypothetical protein QM831_09635 [Kofleriaceae bacterium]